MKVRPLQVGLFFTLSSLLIRHEINYGSLL